MDLIIEIGTYTLTVAWYWILAVAIMGISTLASIYHGKFTPALWGWTVGIIMVAGATHIEPVLFGWMGYHNSNIYLFALSLAMAVLFLLQIAILLNNAIREGEVWA